MTKTYTPAQDKTVFLEGDDFIALFHNTFIPEYGYESRRYENEQAGCGRKQACRSGQAPCPVALLTNTAHFCQRLTKTVTCSPKFLPATHKNHCTAVTFQPETGERFQTIQNKMLS